MADNNKVECNENLLNCCSKTNVSPVSSEEKIEKIVDEELKDIDEFIDEFSQEIEEYCDLNPDDIDNIIHSIFGIINTIKSIKKLHN